MEDECTGTCGAQRGGSSFYIRASRLPMGGSKSNGGRYSRRGESKSKCIEA